MTVRIRAATPSDAEVCGCLPRRCSTPRVLAGLSGRRDRYPADAVVHRPPEDLRSRRRGGRARGRLELPHGERYDPRVGPITVDPHAQGGGIGRRLMEAVLDRASNAAGIRLLQDAFNMRSLSLYASLGFEVREPVLVMSGRPVGKSPEGITVRPLTEQDLDACNALSTRIHGFSRSSELADAVQFLAPVVGERNGRVTGYLTAPTFWIANHGVAETEDDMKGLILGAGAAHEQPLSFLLPLQQANLFRWCLDQGLKAMKPMTLMTIGEYRTPNGSYLPSVFY